MTAVCLALIRKTISISFCSCSISFTEESFDRNLDRLREFKVKGDSEVFNLTALLDKSWGVKRIELRGL